MRFSFFAANLSIASSTSISHSGVFWRFGVLLVWRFGVQQEEPHVFLNFEIAGKSSGITPVYNWTRSSKFSSFASFSVIQRGSGLHTWTHEEVAPEAFLEVHQDKVKKGHVSSLSELVVS